MITTSMRQLAYSPLELGGFNPGIFLATLQGLREQPWDWINWLALWKLYEKGQWVVCLYCGKVVEIPFVF